MLSQREAFISPGEYTGFLTSEMGITGCKYIGKASIKMNVSNESEENHYNAIVSIDFLESNCWSTATENLLFPLKHVEFSATFTTSDIQGALLAEQKHITSSIVGGTAEIPFADKLPDCIKTFINNGKITCSATVEKDESGLLSARLMMFTGLTLFGNVKKMNALVERPSTPIPN